MTATSIATKRHSTHPTKNDIPEEHRLPMIDALNANVANGIDLVAQAKQAHWNVKGPSFFQLHELFDRVFSDANEWVDLMAERVVQLGGTAKGTVQTAAQNSKLPVYPSEITRGPDHVNALSDALAAFGKSVREAVSLAEKAGDAGTADLFTEVSRGADKMLWFLEAHLQSER